MYALQGLDRARTVSRLAALLSAGANATPSRWITFIQALIYQQWQMPRRVLEFGKQFDDAVGGFPAIWPLLAGAHDQLGEKRAAAEYWCKILKFEPGHIQALDALATSFEETIRPLLFDVLKNSSQPVDMAAGIIERQGFLAESGGPKAIFEFFRGLEPNAARTASGESHRSS